MNIQLALKYIGDLSPEHSQRIEVIRKHVEGLEDGFLELQAENKELKKKIDWGKENLMPRRQFEKLQAENERLKERIQQIVDGAESSYFEPDPELQDDDETILLNTIAKLKELTQTEKP